MQSMWMELAADIRSMFNAPDRKIAEEAPTRAIETVAETTFGNIGRVMEFIKEILAMPDRVDGKLELCQI